MTIAELRAAYNEAVTVVRAAAEALAALADDATEEQATEAETAYRAAKETLDERKIALDEHERAEARKKEIEEARALQPLEIPDTALNAATARQHDGNDADGYRANGPHSFFADQVAALRGDSQARARLQRNQRAVVDKMGEKEGRDLTSALTDGGDFLPPIYLAAMYVDVARGGRPFADAVPSAPLPDYGLSITLPSMDTGTAVAEQVDTGSVQETDAVTSTVTHGVFFIAGQQDLWRGVLERSQPGLDMLIMQDLVRAYDEKLDTRLLAGTGTTMHTGIRQVSGVNTVTYTDSSATQAELVPFLYGGVSKINSANVGPADLIVYHPRRAAWLAAGFGSGAPIFQQGAYTWALGSQDAGQAYNPLGLKSVIDPNIGTTYGASTNEDEIYVLNSRELFLMEGAIQTRVFEEVGSGTAAIRLQAFAYSAFISKRRPKAISIVSGTGLTAPSGF